MWWWWCFFSFWGACAQFYTTTIILSFRCLSYFKMSVVFYKTNHWTTWQTLISFFLTLRLERGNLHLQNKATNSYEWRTLMAPHHYQKSNNFFCLSFPNDPFLRENKCHRILDWNVTISITHWPKLSVFPCPRTFDTHPSNTKLPGQCWKYL